MKRIAGSSLVILGIVLCLVLQACSRDHREQPVPTTADQLIAIDVLLEPDQTMIAKASAVNARLRGNYPGGYELDATHAPHVTLLQRFVRAKDFDAVTAAITKVLAAERPTELQLKAKGLEYVMWGGVAVTVVVVERTPELMRLHQKVIDAVAPFSVERRNRSGVRRRRCQCRDHRLGRDIRSEVQRGELHTSRHGGRCSGSLCEATESRALRDLHVQAGWRGDLPARELRHRSEEALAEPGKCSRWLRGTMARAKQSILDFVRRVTTEGGSGLRPAFRTDRRLRQRRDALGRTAVLFPGSVRVRPREGARAAASRVEGQGALRLSARGRHEGRAGRR